jgi:dinuclear metal center YbgI/SA1388 family protein
MFLFFIIGRSMITLQELCAYLDRLLQPTPVSDYCFNGMQVEGKKQIRKLATGVSANLATIQAAAAWGADALLVHHGMFWNQDSHRILGTKKEKLDILFKNDISLLAYHLPLDIHQELGNNWKAALDMGWSDLQPFCLYQGAFLGVKGRFKRQSREDFQKKLEDYYQHSAHAALGGKKEVETAGLISGGSYKFITQAINDQLDCFIAGNFDEPVWNQAFEEKINFYAMGHSATEKIGPKALGEHLCREFKLDYRFIDIYNPF